MDDSEVSIALFNAQLDSQRSQKSIVAELPTDIQWDLDVSTAITKTQKCIKIVQAASKKLPQELLLKLDELLDHLQRKVVVERRNKTVKSRAVELGKAASYRDFNPKQVVVIAAGGEKQKSPVKGKKPVKTYAKSFVSNIPARVKSPVLLSTCASQLHIYPPTNPATFRRLKAMRSQEKISGTKL